MQIKYLSQEQLDELHAEVESNLDLYRKAEPFRLDRVIDTGITVPDFELDPAQGEVANIKLVYTTFKDLPASLLRDARFWTYLTHVPFIGYAVHRWPISNNPEAAVKSIRTHFFAKSERSIESRNAVSSLFWTGHIAARHGDMDEALKVITHNADVRMNFIERPGVLSVPSVSQAFIKRLSASLNDDRLLVQREYFRDIMKNLNFMCGGVAVIECLPQSSVERIVDDAIKATFA